MGVPGLLSEPKEVESTDRRERAIAYGSTIVPERAAMLGSTKTSE